MKSARLIAILFVCVSVLVCETGCSPPPADSGSENSSDSIKDAVAEAERAVIGSWVLDGESTSNGCKRLTDFIPPNHINRLVVESQQAVFDLEIKEDGTFSARKVFGIIDVTMSGDWHVNEEFYLVLSQTMENDQPVTDSMTGRPDSRSMRLMHAEEDFHMAYIFVRSSAR